MKTEIVFSTGNTEPIDFDEAKLLQTMTLPDFVFSAFNELISENLSGNSSRFSQDDAVERLVKKLDELFLDSSRTHTYKSMIFDNHWLDVEDAYRAKGWKVGFDQPAYNESYTATFTFSKKK